MLRNGVMPIPPAMKTSFSSRFVGNTNSPASCDAIISSPGLIARRDLLKLLAALVCRGGDREVAPVPAAIGPRVPQRPLQVLPRSKPELSFTRKPEVINVRGELGSGLEPEQISCLGTHEVGQSVSHEKRE